MDEMEKLSQNAKAFPSNEVLVFKRDEVGAVYLGKDYVALYPKGQNPVLPATVAPVATDPKVTQLEKELNDIKAQLVALTAKPEPKVEVKNEQTEKPKSKKEVKLDAAKKMSPAELFKMALEA